MTSESGTHLDPVLQATGVTRGFRDVLGRRRVPALIDFSLTLHPGEVVGLVGRNGSGKTTALKCCVGLLRPDRGEVRLLGSDPRQADVRARVGYVPEMTDLSRLLTPREILRHHGCLLGLDARERRHRVDELLSALDLQSQSGRLLRKLSHGTVRRVALACGLLNRPRVLFLDEPLANVDPEGVQRFRALLQEAREGGTAVLLSSHILQALPGLTRRLVFLHRGRIRLQGTVEELLGQGTEKTLRVRDLDEAALARLTTEVEALGGTVAGLGPSLKSLEDLYLEQVSDPSASGSGDDRR